MRPSSQGWGHWSTIQSLWPNPLLTRTAAWSMTAKPKPTTWCAPSSFTRTNTRASNHTPLTHKHGILPPQLTLPSDSSSSCSVAVMADARAPSALWFTWGDGSLREVGSLHTTNRETLTPLSNTNVTELARFVKLKNAYLFMWITHLGQHMHYIVNIRRLQDVSAM